MLHTSSLRVGPSVFTHALRLGFVALPLLAVRFADAAPSRPEQRRLVSRVRFFSSICSIRPSTRTTGELLFVAPAFRPASCHPEEVRPHTSCGRMTRDLLFLGLSGAPHAVFTCGSSCLYRPPRFVIPSPPWAPYLRPRSCRRERNPSSAFCAASVVIPSEQRERRIKRRSYALFFTGSSTRPTNPETLPRSPFSLPRKAIHV